MSAQVQSSTIAPEEHIQRFYADEARQGWRVSAEYLRREQVMVNLSTHAMVSDHAVGLGGDDMGPSPGELLLASLAACTAVYIGRNAAKHDIPVESITVRTRFEVAHDDTDGPLATIGYLSGVVKRVEVSGDLTPEQLDHVRFWSEHCAIGETLRRGVDLREELVVVDRDATAASVVGGDPSDPECCTV